ncbi:ABC transporter permease [Psychrobacillus lasiicapitis]|uniref:ABC transporter permease n=1 Tax=Psychrobacillus lasiicapitis TaxID=1636719 RepID=A0A544SWY4_9BACI|nr:ABC transporter permease [Psychrobacillus lasiicapitis]TQR09716.1 ABC transporter permease [Psychrobacillus lasiicapitis]GGA22949.1 ABC transporter permease [Psychrobacillus lasiicapitis]
MLQYTIRRLFSLIPVMCIVSIIVFMIIHLTPGNPAHLILGEDASEESIKQLEEQLGLDQPIVMQYVNWVKDIVTGDFGQSVYSSEPVLDIILGRLGPTFSITIVSIIMILVISIPIAIAAVWKRNTLIDPLFISISLLGVSIPEFWFAMLLVLGFAVSIPLFPVAGYIPMADGIFQWLYHLILPSFVLAAVEIGLVARMLRDGMLESVNQDYIRTARAKGVKESIVLMKHVFSNALIPTTTVIGAMVAGLLGGTVIIETMFTIPGMGQLLVDSIYRRDYPIIQGVILFIAVVYVIVNLLVDLLYTFLDPRIRYD